jgi:hypothetical protein
MSYFPSLSTVLGRAEPAALVFKRSVPLERRENPSSSSIPRRLDDDDDFEPIVVEDWTPPSSANIARTPSMIVGIDPGTRNMGFVIVNDVTLLADFYIIDLNSYVLDPKATTMKGGKMLEEAIIGFVEDFHEVFQHCRAFIIEKQKISEGIIKELAVVMHRVFLLKYGSFATVIQLDPERSRKHWGITVNKKDYPGTTKLQRYNIRKELSRKTNMVSSEDKRRMERCFCTGSVVHSDPWDAALLVTAFLADEAYYLAQHMNEDRITITDIKHPRVKGVTLKLRPTKRSSTSAALPSAKRQK